MNVFNLFLQIFLYVIVVCPINEIVCHASQTRLKERIYGVLREKDHGYKKETPCDVCPRHGRCVPKVQCPAHLRPGSFNPECHLETSNQIGICCFTGGGHAAESDHKLRASSASNPQDLKAAHQQSNQKLSQLESKVHKILTNCPHAIVNKTSPSFGHHLSMVTHDASANALGRGALLNLFATEDLKARQVLSDEDLELDLTSHVDGPFCPPPPVCPSPPSKYRTIGGECNNPANPTWGAVKSGYERLLPPDYSDGIWSIKASASGLPLPNPRVVSQALVLDGSHPSASHNLLFMQFGQFIAHDVSAGVVFTIANGSAVSCCISDGEDFLPNEFQHFGCAPIIADANDIFYGKFKHRCLNFVRTQMAPSPDCTVGYAKQMNGATPIPDLSHLYGNTMSKLQVLRAHNGLLNVFKDYGRELPPLTSRHECLSVEEGSACFESGDNHGNQIISLTVLHTIFTREHNRVVRALARLNPIWDEDVLFFETRRIVQAEFQHIIYNEWLPLLLGPQLVQLFGLSPSWGYSSTYDPHVNPAITTEFATAAMRFGHSVVDGSINLPNPSTNSVYETISIPEVMFQPSRMRLRHFMDRMIIGLMWQPMQSVDPFVTEGLTRYLFHGGNPFGLDLASINIQRGRDWGVRSYNYYRRLIGYNAFEDFNQFSPNTAQRLSSVYSSPDDIDLWIGGLLEEPIEGGIVGVTFAHIIADQFSRIKRGDRYFYENGPDANPGAFSPSQLAEIKKSSLARLICDNRDGLEAYSVSPSAFLRADLSGNEPVSCNIIPGMDLTRFKAV